MKMIILTTFHHIQNNSIGWYYCYYILLYCYTVIENKKNKCQYFVHARMSWAKLQHIHFLVSTDKKAGFF